MSVSFVNTLVKSIIIFFFSRLSLIDLLWSFRSGMVHEYFSLLGTHFKNALKLVFTSLECTCFSACLFWLISVICLCFIIFLIVFLWGNDGTAYYNFFNLINLERASVSVFCVGVYFEMMGLMVFMNLPNMKMCHSYLKFEVKWWKEDSFS